jgi:cation diffusion facilitator CzcD-associated flavoprotein CzcO
MNQVKQQDSAGDHSSDTSEPRFVIIGAGMSGLCLAIQLRQAGYRNITLLEKSNDVGGTWLDNTYPNCGCDVPSFLYSFSFAPNYEWSQKYARQPEILQYFRDCADKYQIRPLIRFSTCVEQATWDDACHKWRVATTTGEVLEADFLATAVGQLNRPRIPEFPGADLFQGAAWHSARWNHDVDLKGKRVAVIGNGASSIQFVPVLAEQVDQLYVFQRSASWIHPLHNYHYPRWMQWCFRNLPLAAKLHRAKIFFDCEWRIIAFREHSLANRIYTWWLRRTMRKQLPEDLHDKLIPDYAPGCKRILLSSDYLQTMQRANVTLVADAVTALNANGVVTGEQSWPVDAIIYGTGFEAADLLQPIQFFGRGGVSLHDTWRDHPQTLYGIMAPQFPNLFLLYGPNTNLGHNSIIYMVEHQVQYILNCLRQLRAQQKTMIEARPEAVTKYDAAVQQKLQDTVWAGGCSSWYKKPDGSIPNNWYGAACSYGRLLKHPAAETVKFE